MPISRHPPLTSGRNLLLVMFVVLSWGLEAQSPPEQEEPEAPEALWEGSLGDRNVELTLEGSWEIQALAGTGFDLGPEGVAAPTGLPGLTLGWLLSQSPLLKLELRMDRRYFFRTDYRGDWMNSSFLIGYEGLQGEPFRWLKLGTEPFTVPAYGGWPLGEGKKGSMQGALGWDSALTSHDLLLRQETGKKQVRTYRGNREVQVLTWKPDQWTREAAYRIPPGAKKDFRLLVEDQSGLRPPREGEVSWDTETGEIRPLAWKGNRLYLTWEGIETSGLPPGELRSLPGFSETFLLIDRLGPWKSTEAKNIYSAEELEYPGAQAEVGLRRRNTEEVISGPWIFFWNSESGTLEVRGSDGSDRPFEALLPGLYSGSPPAETQDYEIMAEVLSSREGFQLPRDLVPGTLEVWRNGKAVTAFTFQPETGTLELPPPLFPQDRIVVSFETPADLGSQFLAALGNRWSLSSGHWIDLGFLLRWNWDQTGWTTEPDEKPGMTQVFLDHNYRQEGLQSRLKLEMEGNLPDSTGLLRWYSADGEPFTATLASRLVRPGSVPSGLDGTLGTGYQFPNRLNRGRLRYRNLSVGDFSGIYALRPYSEEVQPEPYGPGSITGPYLAGGYLEQARTLLVTEYLLEPGQWAASQVFFEEGRLRDLSSSTRLTMDLRAKAPLPSGVRVFFQLGELSEDLDGDGTIDQPRADLSALGFNDGTLDLRIPLDEVSLRSEDWQEKGWLTPDSPLMVTWEITDLLSQPGKTTWSEDLTPSQRMLLTRVNSYRIVVIAPQVLATGEDATTGTVFTSVPVFQGSAFQSTGAQFMEGNPHGTPWESPVLQEISRLSKSNSGSLSIRWVSPGWSGVLWGKTVPKGQYRWFGFSAYNPENQPFTASFRISDSRKQGLEGFFEVPGDKSWHYFQVNLETGEIFRDSQPQPAAARNGSPPHWTDLQITMVSGPLSGSLLLDEFHFRESLFETRGKGTWTAEMETRPWDGMLLQGRWDLQAWSDGSLTFLPFMGLTAGPFTLSGESKVSFEPGRAPDVETGYYSELAWGGWKFHHRFRENGYREEGLSLDIPWGRTEVKSLMVFQKEATLLSLEGFLATGISDKNQPSAQLRGKLTQDAGKASFFSADFAEQWSESWYFLDWNRLDALRRSGSAQVGLGLPYGNFSFRFDSSSQWEEWLLQEEFRADLSAESLWTSQQTAGPQDWNAGLKWERRIRAKAPKGGSGPWGSTLSAWTENWLNYAPDLWSYPGKEWFQGLSPEVHMPGENLRSAFRLKVQRPRLLQWVDLLPGIWESSLEKEISRESQEWFRWHWDNRLETSLINVFGKTGYLPVFSWYETDQGFLSASTRYSLPVSGPETWDFTINFKYSLIQETSSYGTDWKTTWGTTPANLSGQVWGEWSWLTPPAWKFPYITPPRNYSPKLVQRITLDWGSGQGFLTTRVFSQYLSRWEFTPQGSLLGHLKWGQDWNSLRYSSVWELGLAVKLLF